MQTLIAAIDQGTTGTRCMLFDRDGDVVASDYAEHRQILPRPGWVEHNAVEIWERTRQVLYGALARTDASETRIVGLGVTNQRETVVAWNRRTGKPYGNAIVWQCTRTQSLCERLRAQGHEEAIRERTGLLVATYFSAPKMRWLLDNDPELAADAVRGDAMMGTVDAWLVWNLTGGADGGVHVTDVTNASRTMLMDLRKREWDKSLLSLFEIPERVLPEIRPCAAIYGHTVLPDGRGTVPVCGILGDQQAALVGQTCFRPGEAKNTYGTGSFLLMNTGEAPVASEHGLLSTVAYDLPGTRCHYALEGSIAVTGAAVQWLRDNLGLIESAAETEEIAGSVPDSGGVCFVPAFSGLFAPHWDMYARGAIMGLTRYATKAHLVRATLEAICYQSREVLEAMAADAGLPLRTLRADGGASANNLLMQLQSDILNTPVVRPIVRETTALGAAYAAGLTIGFWDTLGDLGEHWRVERTFEPSWSEERRDEGWTAWRKAVERTRGWIEA